MFDHVAYVAGGLVQMTTAGPQRIEERLRSPTRYVLDVDSCSIQCCMQHVPVNPFPLCSVTLGVLTPFLSHESLLFDMVLQRE